MRDTLISLLDMTAYIVVVFTVLLASAWGYVYGGGKFAILFGMVGLLVAAFTCGMWLALSGIYWNQQQMLLRMRSMQASE